MSDNAPAAMDQLEAARFHAGLMELQLLQSNAFAIQARQKAVMDKLKLTVDKYELDQDLPLDQQVNFETGEIRRQVK